MSWQWLKWRIKTPINEENDYNHLVLELIQYSFEGESNPPGELVIKTVTLTDKGLVHFSGEGSVDLKERKMCDRCINHMRCDFYLSSQAAIVRSFEHNYHIQSYVTNCRKYREA